MNNFTLHLNVAAGAFDTGSAFYTYYINHVNVRFSENKLIATEMCSLQLSQAFLPVL